ncbi:hypothetical protein SORBI_3010G028366 [Sorghum bicolor]|uniref:Uncharacterized protein n=1 Tax=Sorghum bicolor TaxID=4558 RepID=A0A1W0VR85_SORBI|nr:hypothetical protein SORBI_3010G028366 [Sorghum bicolor]
MQFPDHQLMLHLVAAGGLFAGSGRKYSEFQTRFTFGCFGFKFQHLRSPFFAPCQSSIQPNGRLSTWVESVNILKNLQKSEKSEYYSFFSVYNTASEAGY